MDPDLSIGARLRRQGPGIALGILCLGATNALGMAIPWLLKIAVDALRAQAGAALALVTRHALLIAGFAVLQAVIRTWSRILIFNAGRDVEFELRRDLFACLCRQPPSFYRRHPTGDVMSRMTNDLGAVRMLFGPGVLNVANTLIAYATGLSLMLTLSPRLTAWALLPFPFLILGGRAFTRGIYRLSRDLQDQLGQMSAALQEDLAGIAVVKSYAIEDRRREAFAERSGRMLHKALDLARTRGLLVPLFAGIGGIGTLVVLWAGGREVIAGRLTVGEMVAFNAYLLLLSWPTVALGWMLSLWQRGMAAWARVREILAEQPAISDPAGPPAAPPADASIRIRDLTVSAGDRTLLDRISLDVPSGGSLAVVGRTGSGKSTLTDVLTRFTEAPAGTVSIGGRDVTALRLADLRRRIGLAPQETFLFSATVAENVGFARDGVERAEIRRAAEAAGLERDLAAFPDGLDTQVGERGITLSGGQRQRIALARALCADPAILILDDSLSSVDADTEARILARLRPYLYGRTSVLVSHRVAAVKDADEIVVLDHGRIAERGTHAALVARGGLYADLYREQLDEEALR